MSTIVNTSTLEQSDAGPSLQSRFATAFKAWWVAYLNWRMHQLAEKQLRSMSDRELKDIGLTRTQIDAALRGDVARDRSLARYR